MDEGEIGRGAYGTVNRMVHSRSGTVMAVKVRADLFHVSSTICTLLELACIVLYSAIIGSKVGGIVDSNSNALP